MASLLNDFIKIAPRISFFTPQNPTGGQLIILCTWLGAARKHISKYTALYRNLAPGARILLVESNLPIITSSYARQRRAIKPALSAVLEILAECGIGSVPSEKTDAASEKSQTVNNSRHSSLSSNTNQPAPQIFLHVFSNGGTTSATQLLLVLKAHLGTPLPLAGLVCDSCPANGTYWRSHEAMVLSLPKDPATRVLGALVCHCILVMLYMWIACGNENPSTLQRRTMLDGEFVSPSSLKGGKEVGGERTGGRVCYIYSKADRMCWWPDVKHHAEEARMLGWDVSEVLFQESEHCAHLAKDEERYADSVKRILYWGGSERREKEMLIM